MPSRERVLTRAAACESRNRLWLSLWLNIQLAWLVRDRLWTRYIWRLNLTDEGAYCMPTWYRMRRREFAGSVIAVTEVEVSGEFFTISAKLSPYSLFPAFNWTLYEGKYTPQPGESVSLRNNAHRPLRNKQEFAEKVRSLMLHRQAEAMSQAATAAKLDKPPTAGTQLLPRPAKPTDES